MSWSVFLLRIDPSHATDYVIAHERVWPELVRDLQAAGWADYQLFLDRASGLIVGLVQSDDFETARDLMKDSMADRKWDATMNWMFVPLDESRPVGQRGLLEKVFDIRDAISLESTRG